eukprot:scaffold112068_cov49-Attheya_sp.AAC.3
MRLVLAVGTLVAFLGSEVSFQSCPPFCAESVELISIWMRSVKVAGSCGSNAGIFIGIGRRVVDILWSCSIFFSSTLELSDQYSLDQRSEDNVESSSPPPCSYELLHKAFRHRSDQTKKQSDEDELTTEQRQRQPQDCWRPEEEVLQIPVDAILNRHDMDGIGAGSKGGVYKSIIQLDYTTMSGNDHVLCTAALKTEECRPIVMGRTPSSSLDRLEEHNDNDDDWISCVDPRARSSEDSDMTR